MNPTLRQMRAFVALAKSGNFTLAAQALHVTQSALSGLIKELEQTLGARVVDRSTRRIDLTDIGRELYPLFSQMIDDLDGALANVADHTRLKKGVVRIAAPQLLACTLLPQVIAAWRERHPKVEVRLADTEVEGVVNRVLSGEADVGIGPERMPAAPLEARQLFEMPFAAVFPQGHPLETQERVTWHDLAAYPLISLQGQFTERLLDDMHAAAAAAARAVTVRPAHEVTFMTTALAMVGAGLGVTVCLPYAAPLVAQHRLALRPLEEPVLSRRFLVYTRPGRSLSPAAEAFIAFLFGHVERVYGAPALQSGAPSSARPLTMSLNTIAINQQMNRFDSHASVWLFGYGSLIFKADFPFIERRPAYIRGWTRRFWQGSHDHRGTETAPGRVVTLAPQEGAVCHGMAYLVTPEEFAHLDHREKNGYLRLATDMHFEDGSTVEGIVYIATHDNAAYLGPAGEPDIARQIASARGPSGPNSEYLLRLAQALRELGKPDEHVFELERQLIALGTDGAASPA